MSEGSEQIGAATDPMVAETASSGRPAAEPVPVSVASARKAIFADWLSGIQWLAFTVTIALFVITFLLQAFQIPSESMENTLLVGDYLLVDKAHYGHGGFWNWLLPYSQIHDGDIIVFRYPVNPTQHFVKRVIGVPGDHIRMFRGRVFVNEHLLNDSPYAIHQQHDFDSYRDNFPDGNYISPEVDSSWWIEMHKDIHDGELVVPPGEYFVLGDNRDDSLDSRYWGFVPRGNIIGRPLVIYWSVERRDDLAGDGKLDSLLDTLVHLPEDARWHRTFHLVR